MDYTRRIKKLETEKIELQRRIEELETRSTEKSKPADLIKNLFQSGPLMMAIANLESGCFEDVNAEFLKVLGYKRENVIGKKFSELGLFSDINEINKYLKLVAKLKRIKDLPATLTTSGGLERSFILSAESTVIDDTGYLMFSFNPISSRQDLKISESHGLILEEIFNTISSYLALFSIGDDNHFYITDLNSKAAEVEFVDKIEVTGARLNDTILARRSKLVELLNHLRVTGTAHKLAASEKGDDSEGYYMGFPLSSGNIIITWEPGKSQKQLEDLNNQTMVFQKYADYIPEMIYEVDAKGKILYGNSHGLKYFGYTEDDLNKGLYISDIFPESYKAMLKNLAALQNPGEISSNEYIARKKDGTLFPIIAHSYAVFYEGRIVKYRGTVTDITSQKNYEEQIIREKAFLEHLIDSTPEAIAITDYPGRITMINKEFTSLFGYSQEEAAGKMIDDLIVPDELRSEAITIDELATLNHKEVRQTIRKDKSGNSIFVSLIATSISVNNQNVAFLGIYRDITNERKSLLLQEILFNISSAALKLMDIREMYPIIVNELSKIWDTNNFFIALYNEESETLSLPFFSDEKDSFNEIPISRTITGYVIKNNKSVLLRENDIKMLEEKGEIDLVGTDCKVWMGVPLRVEDKSIGVMCLQDYNNENKFTHDDLNVIEFISNQIALAIQRRIMLDNLIAARQKAEEAAQSKQIFMSTMSHEIRTPLNEVLGITNLLLQGNPREDQMDYIKTLRFSGNHLLTLVNDVLDYNKMESGKIVFEQAQFNLDDFLDEIMRSYSFRSQAKQLTFSIKKDERIPGEVIGDQIRLNQILSNLLSNALKFTSSGGISVNLNLLDKSDERISLEFLVSDTGIGIPKEKHNTIFESFTQASADTTRHFGGSGLGLAICKKLVELQGGTIRVESEPNAGSKFYFTITFGMVKSGIRPEKEESQESFSGLEGKKILVAEDNKVNFFVANKFLTGWGVTVTHAENGKIALDLLENNEYDLILMDLHMPVMDGIEATRIIRNSDNVRIKNMPVVALTAAIMSENHDKIDELNINDYILKPFKPHDLFDRILKHVKKDP